MQMGGIEKQIITRAITYWIRAGAKERFFQNSYDFEMMTGSNVHNKPLNPPSAPSEGT